MGAILTFSPQGGHVDTYYDPSTGEAREYGVAMYFPYEDSNDFFTELNVTLLPAVPGGTGTINRYIDFSTGEELANYVAPDDMAAIMAIAKYHDLAVEKGYDNMTQPGYWGLPAGPEIPEDLLLPIGEFVAKYELEAMLPLMYSSTGGGVGSRGDFQNIMTLTVMKAFPPGWVKVFLGQAGIFQVEGGNQLLFDKIAALLGNDVLYNTTVSQTLRTERGVSLVVNSHSGSATGCNKKLIIAKKLLVAVPPTRENLAPFDLNAAEKAHFAKPKYGRSHKGIVAHPKAFVNGTSLNNRPASAVAQPLFPFLGTPFVMDFTSYGADSNLFSLGSSGSDFNQYDEAAAQAEVQAVLETMAAAGTIPDLEGEPVEIVAWSDHSVGGFGVSPREMRDGWMSDMYALQGKRSTWFTGGGIAADFTTMLWKFNDDLLPRLVADL